MKLHIAFGVALVSAAVQAEFMMWSVKESQILAGDVEIDDVAYMRVGYVTKNGNEPCWTGTALTAYDSDGISMGGSDVDYVSGADYKVDLTSVSVDTYSFYIELLNSDHEVIGRSGSEDGHTYTTYAQLKNGNYVATGSIADVPSVNIWHGSASFEAVPEPSSMALLALGAGLVGLRRKLKKGKKEKRA